MNKKDLKKIIIIVLLIFASLISLVFLFNGYLEDDKKSLNNSSGNASGNASGNVINNDNDIVTVGEISVTEENELYSNNKANKYTFYDCYKCSSNVEYEVYLNNKLTTNKVLYYTTNIDEYDNEAHLFIDGKDYSNMTKLYLYNEDYYVCDIDKSDNYIEIAISTYGYSDDLETQWFRYDGNNLIDLGITQMIPEQGIKFNSDEKTLTIYDRFDIVQTDFIDAEYEIKDNKIIKVNKDIYNFVYDAENIMTTNIDLNVHNEINNNKYDFTIPKNSEIDITKTDGKEWVNILYGNNEYWAHVKDFKFIDNDNICVWEAINDIFQAD